MQHHNIKYNLFSVVQNITLSGTYLLLLWMKCRLIFQMIAMTMMMMVTARTQESPTITGSGAI